MRRLVVLVLVALAGCGSESAEKLPAACSEGPEVVVKALAAAPGAVTVQGTPISRCFNRGASGDDEQILGTALVGAAQQLADDGQAVALGYLVGAARRGSQRNGLGAEIVRRLEAESTAVKDRAGYARGLRAGLSTG